MSHEHEEYETAQETIDRVTKEAKNLTLDEWFDRNPKTMTKEDWYNYVRECRKLRALRIEKKEARG